MTTKQQIRNIQNAINFDEADVEKWMKFLKLEVSVRRDFKFNKYLFKKFFNLIAKIKILS